MDAENNIKRLGMALNAAVIHIIWPSRAVRLTAAITERTTDIITAPVMATAAVTDNPMDAAMAVMVETTIATGIV